jgi:hypothetical protein
VFGNKEKKAAEEAAAQVEFERLTALPVAELAAELMPAFGPDGAKPSSGSEVNTLQIIYWLVRNTPRMTGYTRQLMDPVRAGLELLETSGLVLQRGRGGAGVWVKATPLGQTALAEGTVREHLQVRP